MKPEPPPLRVGTPCPKQWDDLTGDTKRRFCEHCQLHVHNLSAMSRPERDRFVTESEGRACIVYQLRPDGTMVTPSLWSHVWQPFQRVSLATMTVLAALLPFLFPACASRKTLGRASPLPTAPEKGCHTDRQYSVMLGSPVVREPSPANVPPSK